MIMSADIASCPLEVIVIPGWEPLPLSKLFLSFSLKVHKDQAPYQMDQFYIEFLKLLDYST